MKWALLVSGIFTLGFALGSCGSLDPDVDLDEHWHSRYIADHCERCPECCVVIPDDDRFCDNCPGEACQCILDAEGWTVDYTAFGTDEDPLNPIGP